MQATSEAGDDDDQTDDANQTDVDGPTQGK